MPDIDTFELSLKRADSPLLAAEAHGLLTGMLSASMAAPFEDFVNELLEDEQDPQDALLRESVHEWKQLYDEVKSELYDPDMGFEPLLPNEDVPLANRLAALGEWCQGFVYGLGRAGLKPETLKGDSAELLRDFAEISRISQHSDETEEDEAAYFELVEFVRVGVLLINEELQPFKAPPVLQ